jgi:hypothetical protein
LVNFTGLTQNSTVAASRIVSKYLVVYVFTKEFFPAIYKVKAESLQAIPSNKEIG